MVKYILLSILICLNSIVASGQKAASLKIEIYLLKPSGLDSSRAEDFYFVPNKSDIVDTPLIKDVEIIAYNIKKDENENVLYSYIDIKEDAFDKITKLSIDLAYGRRFAIAVNGLPLVGGYFWNGISSFGCNWIAVVIFRDEKKQNKLVLGKGVGYSGVFNDERKDPRGKADLLDAFKKSGRLHLLE